MAKPQDSSESLPTIASSLLHSALDHVLHNLILQRHREHKLTLASLDPITKLPHCERCNLPKYLDPPLAPSVRGSTTNPPADTVYCDRRPWCRKNGFDIYGNPFPKADLTGRPPTKKEKEAAARESKKNPDGTPASNEGGTAPPSPTPDDGKPSTEKLEKGEKKASKIDEKLKKGEYVPWQTCPNCKRSLLITRFAKHLEQCMDLNKGRAAARNAMAKMNGSGNSGTPAGSRSGTPAPESGVNGSGGVGGEDDEDEVGVRGGGGVRKKVLKKGLNSKLGKSAASNNKSGKDGATTNGTAKHSTSQSQPSDTSKRDFDSFVDSDGGGGGAHDDDDGDNVHVKKRQKLQRVESTTSFGSQSVEMERTESQDAWVNDGSSLVDGEESD